MSAYPSSHCHSRTHMHKVSGGATDLRSRPRERLIKARGVRRAPRRAITYSITAENTVIMRIFSRGGVRPIDTLPPRTPSTQSHSFHVPNMLDPSGIAALHTLTAALKFGDRQAMLRAGERGMVTDKQGNRYYLTSSEEEATLAWAARTFARRNGDPGTHCDWSASFDSTGRTLGLTSSAAKGVDGALRELICRGTGGDMADCAARVIEAWGTHHESIPKLRALTWAARVLGERDFDTPVADPEAYDSVDETCSSVSSSVATSRSASARPSIVLAPPPTRAPAVTA